MTGLTDKTSVLRVLDKRARTWLSSGMVQGLILINGLILTVAAFVVLSIFIQGMMQDEYDRVTESTVDVMTSGISNLENSVRTMTSILALAEEDDRSVLASRLRQATPNLSLFDQVIWLYETRPGIWQYNSIHRRSEHEIEGKAYYAVPDRDFISALVSAKHFADDKLRAVSNLKGMEYLQERREPRTMSRSFALVQAVDPGKPNKGIVIGISRTSNVLGASWLQNRTILSRLTIRDLDNGNRIYHMDRESEDSERFSDLSESYDFLVGETNWEIVLEFLKGSNVVFLEKVPYLALFFGLVLTIFGTLYVRNHQKQARVLTMMNKALEQKNIQLQQEVKEREKLNQSIRKAERDNRAIIDSVSDIIFETDQEGKIVFLNATWGKITGFDPEQSRGHEIFTMLHPQDQQRQRQDFKELVQGRKVAYRAFTRLRVSDGTFRSVELAVSMMRQDDNKELRVVGTITDVEERRRAERALSEAEKKYRTIVENAAGGIYQLTPEGLYLSANPAMARILGYESREDVLRANANRDVYVDTNARAEFRASLEEKGFVTNQESQVRRKDGSVIWINENARTVCDEGGNVLYYEGSIADITHRKSAELALREAKLNSDIASRAKSDFLANMSHELRTPLNAIIGFSEIIKNEVMGPVGNKAYWEYARDIHESGKGLLKVINEILDISKIDSGERQLNDSIVDVGEIIEDCLGILAPKIESSQMTINKSIAGIPKIVGEEKALKQVILNLMSNALKFTPSGGTVTLTSEVDADGDLRLSITDTGIGLDEAEIEKALSPFGQVDNELSREGSGVGLGLTLANSMVKLHGGRLELFSEKGIGTTVTIILPAERVQKPKNKPAPADTEEVKG